MRQYLVIATGLRRGIVRVGLSLLVGSLAMAASVLAGPGDSPLLIGAASRKVHAAAGTFDLPLSLTLTNPTTEPRAGPTQTIVFTFDKPVTDGVAVVTEGTAAPVAPSFSGNSMIVPLTGVTNQQYVTVAVSNVVAADGGTGGSGSIRVGFMLGDVTQNRVVTLSDLGQVNAQVAQVVTAANFLKDVNVSGTLSLANKGITNTQLTKALPAPPTPAEQPPQVNAGANQAITLPAGASLAGTVNDDGLPNPPATVTLTWSKVSGPGTVNFANPNAASTSATFSLAGTYVLRLTASDGTLNNADNVTITVGSSTELPPDPSTVAPPVGVGVVTNVGISTAFLYTDANPIQTGVLPGTIDVKRAAVLRGRVVDRAGASVPGVTISIVGHPEFGQTLSRADGRFDMAANGGGLLALNYSKDGFLPLQRQVGVPWQDYVVVKDVVMVGLDSAVTTVTANAGVAQVHQASLVTDGDGARRAVVLFPAGTTAVMTLPGGSTQPLSTLHVRATEYTVGPSGPAAMPAGLPPLSGYTYCVELSADEVIAAGAIGVIFSQPVITYVENFLNFPVGLNVPVGLYDRVKAAWVPSPNGRVVKILGVTGGLADVDTDGDNVADNGLGMTSGERASLASIFSAGQTLWRMPVSHFTPGDGNLALATPNPPNSPGQHGAGPVGNNLLQDGSCAVGSIIECENQILGEAVPIVGTPFTLNYRSDRVPGRVAKSTIRLIGPSVPPSLASIDLHLSVAGRNFDQTFAASPNQETTFVWDGLDAYGRHALGGQTLSGKIDYNYPTMYVDPGPLPSAFNTAGGATLSANPARQQIAISQAFTTTIGEGLTDARTIGLGGWTLSVHHVYDPNARVVHLGGGSRRRAGSLARILTFANVVGQSILFDVEVGPDGSQYIALPHGDLIVRVGSDGTQSIVAGNGVEGFSGDGGPATQAMLGDPTGVAVAPDGSLYIAEQSNFRVRRVSPNGIISTVAGTGIAGFSGDGGLATQAQLSFAERIAVAPDSSFYLLDGQRIRRVTPDGIIKTVAGTGAVGGTGDGGPATAATFNAASLSVAADGGVYIADFGNHRVRRVGPDGIIKTVADYTAQLGRPVSVRPTKDGGLLIAVDFASAKTPQVDLLKADGSIVTVAGGGPSAIQQGIPATQANLVAIKGVAVGPDGSVYVVQGDGGSRLLRIGPSLSGFEGTQIPIISADGAQMYIFDAQGRHLRTVDALTGGILIEFGYDVTGRLNQVTEKTGGTDNVTTIQRDGAGNPTSITGPYGQVTTLATDGNGFLNSIGNPAAETVQMTSGVGGLLASYTDPRGKVSAFSFDSDGRLLIDADAAGGSQALARSALADQFIVTRTTALGRTTTYKVEAIAENEQQRTLTEPDGTQIRSDENIDAGKTHAETSDGMSSDTVIGPDPRFGMGAPVSRTIAIATPGGLNLEATTSVTAILANLSDPMSLVSLTETKSINGRTMSSTYTASTRVIATATPTGRTSVLTIDALGRPVSSQLPGLASTTIAYDNHGRISTMTQASGGGARTITFAYDANGFVQSITDPIGRSTHFAYDAAGRLASKTFPDGHAVAFGRDVAGDVTSLSPPGRPAYTFTFSDRNELTGMTPPFVPGTGSTGYSYNVDRQRTIVTSPDGRTMTFGYDASGRPNSRILATNGVTSGTDILSYDAVGRLSSLQAVSGVTTSYAYDGPLLTSRTWSGPISGSVGRSFDANFRVSSESINGANTVNFTYDNDNLLTAAGGLTIARDAQSGLPVGGVLGVTASTAGYNVFGEVTSYATAANGTTQFASVLTRDALGRITSKVETIGGSTDTYEYSYDVAGQLATVSKNGNPTESYSYDTSGNRIGATVSGSSVVAAYDDQDRLNQYGSKTYARNAAGDLVASTAGGSTVTSYQYDQLGNLLGVALPGGASIAYVVDANNRRVGKKINGALVKQFLYRDGLRIAAELDGTGVLISQFVFGASNVPAYMIKGGVNYRIVSDHLGSVRLVIDASSGAIVQRMDYDAFGTVMADSNPGFQPFGFAGGLYDPDTRLVRFGARDFDAETGRWTNKDPIAFGGGDFNVYRYVSNDPINSTDRSGKSEPSPSELMAYLRDVMKNTKEALKKGANEWESREIRRDMRNWAESELEALRRGDAAASGGGYGKLNCGGRILGVAMVLLQVSDVLQQYQRAQENDRTLFEQEAAEEDEARARGVTSLLGCLGPVCLVKDLTVY